MSNETERIPVRKAALIGGSGFAGALDREWPRPAEIEVVDTVYGAATVKSYPAPGDGRIYFLERHGERHTVAPHRINHKANFAALAALGVSRVLATSAVGSLRRELDPGSMIVLDDLVDLRGGVTTFFDGDEQVRHTDFSEPFSQELRLMVLEEASEAASQWLNPPLIYPAGTYLCLNGPRYETPAEVRLFASWGLDVVGMTVAPEAILARELDIAYCNVAIVANLGTGLSGGALSHAEVEAQMASSRPFLLTVLMRTLRRLVGAEDD